MLSHLKAFWNYLRAYLTSTKDVKGDDVKNDYTKHTCFIKDIYIEDVFFIRITYILDISIWDAYTGDFCSINIVKHIEIYL